MVLATVGWGRRDARRACGKNVNQREQNEKPFNDKIIIAFMVCFATLLLSSAEKFSAAPASRPVTEGPISLPEVILFVYK